MKKTDLARPQDERSLDKGLSGEKRNDKYQKVEKERKMNTSLPRDKD